MPQDPSFRLIRRELRDPDQRPHAARVVARPFPPDLHSHAASAADYQLSERLEAAVNAALAVGAPLLLTGDPGTGKTQLAWYLAWYLRCNPVTVRVGDQDVVEHRPYTLSVKSTTTSTDLLYSFDTVAYFHASYESKNTNQKKIDKKDFRTKGPLWLAFEDILAHRPAVVLIDEIDKAPRDFPNDLLHELDQYGLRCPETEEELQIPRGTPPPVVILTSNAEKRLPEAFLRRTIFHHVRLDEASVAAVVMARARGHAASVALQEAAQARFWEIHGRRDRLRKVPSTGELLGWLALLQREGVSADAVRQARLADLPHLGALLKDRADFENLG